MSTEATDIQEIIDEAGIDIDLETEETQIKTPDLVDEERIESEISEINITESYPPDSDLSPVDFSQTVLHENGSQIKVNYSQRPECPNPKCGYTPTAATDHSGLKPKCSICKIKTCSGCYTECVECEEPMCQYCSKAYVGTDEEHTLCPDCAGEAKAIDKFERNLRAWEIQLESQIRLLQSQIDYRELEFDREMQEKQMEAELEIDRMRQQIEAEKVRNEQRRIKLEDTKARLKDKRERQKQLLDQEIKRRKRRLEEFEALVDAKIRGREQKLEELKAEREHELAVREQELEELNAERDHEIAVREQELEEAKQQVEALESLMEISKQNRVQARKDWELLIDTRERLQDLKWNEVNEFLDFQGRLQNEDFERIGSTEDDKLPGEEDDGVIVIESEVTDSTQDD